MEGCWKWHCEPQEEGKVPPQAEEQRRHECQGYKDTLPAKNDERIRKEEEEEKKRVEEEEALAKRKQEEEEAAKKKEEEAVLAKRKEVAVGKKEEEQAPAKRVKEEGEAAKKKEEEAGLAKRKESQNTGFGPSGKELQRQKQQNKEELWTEVVKRGYKNYMKRKAEASPPTSPDWGSSSSSEDPCRKDQAASSSANPCQKGSPVPNPYQPVPNPCQKDQPVPSPCQKDQPAYDKLVLRERVPTWVAVDWFRTIEHDSGWWDRPGLRKLVNKGIKVWVLSCPGQMLRTQKGGLVQHCSITAQKCGRVGKAAIMNLWGVQVCTEIVDEAKLCGLRTKDVDA